MMTMDISSNPRRAVIALTALAPISWGTTYVTVTELLPHGRPLFVATMRVVPAGLVLLAAGFVTSRWRPRGAEWWRLAKLGVFNFGLFFPLLITAVYRLPGGVAAAVGGLQPILVAALAWPLAGRKPRARELLIGGVAAAGVALVAIRPGAHLDAVGLLAAAGANASFAVGVVLTKRSSPPPNRLSATGWQLLIGGAMLLPLTALVDGAPPALSARNLAGFAYLSLVCTALAFVIWFNGIRSLPHSVPPLLGLAAPITGAVVGWIALGQSLSPVQLVGFCVVIGAMTRSIESGSAEQQADDGSSPGETIASTAGRRTCRDMSWYVDANGSASHLGGRASTRTPRDPRLLRGRADPRIDPAHRLDGSAERRHDVRQPRRHRLHW